MNLRLLVPLMALAAFGAYRLAGLAGATALLVAYALLGAVAWQRMRTNEGALVTRLADLSDEELRDALPQLDAASREEVERVLRRSGRLPATGD
ncbi:MAG: hypothetical protein AAGH15_17670 [Myxococcota bacterium]